MDDPACWSVVAESLKLMVRDSEGHQEAGAKVMTYAEKSYAMCSGVCISENVLRTVTQTRRTRSHS